MWYIERYTKKCVWLPFNKSKQIVSQKSDICTQTMEKVAWNLSTANTQTYGWTKAARVKRTNLSGRHIETPALHQVHPSSGKHHEIINSFFIIFHHNHELLLCTHQPKKEWNEWECLLPWSRGENELTPCAGDQLPSTSAESRCKET